MILYFEFNNNEAPEGSRLLKNDNMVNQFIINFHNVYNPGQKICIASPLEI